MDAKVVRYIINSKDRTAPGALPVVSPVVGYVSDSPADFSVVLNPPIDVNVSEFWVKLQNIAIPSVPLLGNKSYLAAASGRYGLDTNAFIDLCIDYQQAQTVDTDNGIAEKQGSDNTFAIIPYDLQNTEGIVRMFNDQPWVRVRNNGQHQAIRVKLFADTGLQLATRKFGGDVVTTPGAVTMSGVDPAPANRNAGQYFTQLRLIVGALPANLTRGDVAVSGTLLSYIYGTITVISTTSSSITIGFPRQTLPASVTTGLTVGFSVCASTLQPLQDWVMELLVSTTNPVKDRIL